MKRRILTRHYDPLSELFAALMVGIAAGMILFLALPELAGAIGRW